ncbi:MAG: TonB-dependent receptor [Gammaproteobacteria bacterium]|nr:TonB-dependent receptor [Gammaproteobacteria bacterium]MBU1645211.1 TonB-dependent receptor [Gammaproteobacteria bacterium]MBU1973448.1 TonB-dependent receptor [Gammaproteobacteria bacterium]
MTRSVNFRRTGLAAALAALPFVAIAQEASTTLSPVVVSAPKSDSGEATRLDAAGIAPQRAATSDTASLLKDVPGISLYGSGGVSSLPAIHGLADDRLRIKVDGMDLLSACPNHMNPALSYLDPSQVGSIKVYAGIAPVSVGGDSIGGSIIAETVAPVFATPGQGSLFQGEAGAFYRSNGNAQGGNLAATVATESFSLSYTGAVAKSDNYKAGGDFKDHYFGASNATNLYQQYSGRPGHTLPLDEVGSTAYDTRNHTLGLAFKGGNHLFEAKFGYQDLPSQLWPNQRMDMLGNTQNRLNLRYLGQFAWGALDARVYHEDVDHFMDFGADKKYWYNSAGGADYSGAPCNPVTTPACASGMPMYTASKNTGVVLKADVNLTQQDLLRLGSEYQRYRLDDWWPASGAGMAPFTFWNVKEGERDRSAVFGEWERYASREWMTLAGLRYERVKMDAGDVHGYIANTFPTNPLPVGAGNQTRDAANFNNADHSKTDNNWDMTALARYTPDAMHDVEFGFAHKTRSPNLHERYAWSTWTMAALMVNWTGDGNGYVGNLDLKPEKANTLSATFDWHAADRSWEFKATPYYTRVTDYIDAIQWDGAKNIPLAVPDVNKFTVLKFVNQSARLHGIDLSGKMPLAKTGAGEFGLKGLLNYTNGRNRDSGDDLYNIMPLNAKLALTHKRGGWDNAIELQMVKRKSDGSDVRNEMQTPGYSLVNLRGSYSWKQVRVDLGVDNLFDRHYYLPLGGAYTGQGTTMSSSTTAATTPKWGTGVPGAGRSLYAGVNLKF